MALVPKAWRIVVAMLLMIGIVFPPAAQSQTAPKAPPVVSVTVTGNAHVPTDRILSVVKTKVGDPFDPAVVQDDLKAISDLGFFADQAPPIVKQRPDGIAITFRVIENPVITSIQFTGNAHVPNDTLLALMDTATGQVFNANTFRQDVLKINSYYDKIGYGGQVSTHVADLDVSAKTGVLTLKVVEGLTVRNVKITGDPVLPPNLILATIATKPGSPYSQDASDKDFERLKELYKKFDIQIGDFESGIDPTSVDQKAGTADVTYNISVARVGAVEIKGNSKTQDQVIRRELRLKPGAILTESALRRDYERLNNLGFFEKVDFVANPGPDPKKPALLTVAWEVKEQRTGTAQIGAGYSGGLTGTGLTGTLSYSENNINGTGNSGAIRFEKGSQISSAQISFTIPYFGKSEATQKYSVSATIFTNATTNYYPVYAVPTAAPVAGAPAPTPTPIGAVQGVSLIPADPNNVNQISGIAATYYSRTTGTTLTVGRRLSDYTRASVGVNLSQVAVAAQVPSGFYFGDNSTVAGITTGCGGSLLSSSQCSGTAALGIVAPSIANVDSTKPYNLFSFNVGIAADTRDDVFNPRTGLTASLGDEISPGSLIGSAFKYQIITLDSTRFFPVLKNATLGFHLKVGTSTGAIPPNRLFTFSDQDLRGYKDIFYGTDILLGQGELRYPLTPDRKFVVAAFVDDGATRIRGASPSLDANGNPVDLSTYQFHPDVGIGLRFDVPQLGLRTIRLDFARGNTGVHTAFGIGQSF
jgi:outer membrane protein assembly factor BamA